jgi:hypothetical protein
MKNYTDSELKKELYSRGYEVFDKDYATEYMWTIDDAIDAYNEIKERHFTHDELTKDKLMEILNSTISSSYITELISERLQQNIYENLFED